jgi:uncharacterized protein with von Willebrand factor type A (vWA) domain
MFESLPHTFREYNLKADVRTLIMLRKSFDRGLIRTLGDIYLVLKGLITNSPKEYGPFTQAFYQYFLDIPIKKGEMLDSAILRSETFKNWKEKYLEDWNQEEEPESKALIDQFLQEVHLSSYDIKKILDGKEVLSQDDPNRKDSLSDEADPNETNLDTAIDYSDVPLEELLERMKQVAQQQLRRHAGGNHWIGQGGNSPYGNNGAAKGGVRVGGSGGGKMARKVIGDRNFYPVDRKLRLQDNNVDVALAYLKGIEDETAYRQLDIPMTIKQGVKEGGLFLPYEKEKIEQKVQVILMIDNGGWSMSPYIKPVTKLFSKMKRRFAHDLKTYYYHNTIYGGAYKDAQRLQFISIDRMLKEDKNYSIFVIGDADMASYELSEESIQNWQALQEKYPRMVWLNPVEERFWPSSYTINVLRQVIPMYPLTPEGIERAVLHMNQKRQFQKT